VTAALADFIRKRRRELGLSQTEASERTKGRLSHTTIANLEKGTDPRTGKPRHPRAVTLKILAPALEVSYETLAELAGYILKEGGEKYGTEQSSLDGRHLTEEEKAIIRALRDSRRQTSKK
jgi:transcriptional regulator with XRE-family HTH domain